MRTATALLFALSFANAQDLEPIWTEQSVAAQPGFVRSEFLYEKAPFPECHASTLAETSSGIVAAWFGGRREKSPDVGIWVSRRIDGAWSTPVEVANGVQFLKQDGKAHRHPCWNPVLFQPAPRKKTQRADHSSDRTMPPLMLFYKCGPDPASWWGMLTISRDGGATWQRPRRLPEHIDGPAKNKPIQLDNGDILCGASTESNGWRVHFERTPDFGVTWYRTPAIHDGKTFGAIQPTILAHTSGKLQALCRSRQSWIVESWSEDKGATWSKPEATKLPNPNSGVDAVRLADGRHLLVYNHTRRARRSRPGPALGRKMLNVAVREEGRDWAAALVLERGRGEYSYPAVIQTRDGRVHVSYTWHRRKIKYVVIDPGKLELRGFENSNWR